MDKIYPEEHIQAIANAIRRKNGRTVNYLTSEMAGAIDQLVSYPEPTGTQTITENGIVDVKDKQYADVNVQASATLISKTITANGEYDAEDDEADGYSDVTVDVPNSYAAADEGKVVSNGALVAQTSTTVTQNGTVDTTLNNEVVVSVTDPITAYHVWTRSAQGEGASMWVQEGTYEGSTFTPTGEQTRVNFNGQTETDTDFDIFTLTSYYVSAGNKYNWKATANTSVYDGSTNDFDEDDIIKDWNFSINVDFYIIELVNEGKVVHHNELVSQTSTTVTQNGTYDTTLNNEVVVSVSGGSETPVEDYAFKFTPDTNANAAVSAGFAFTLSKKIRVSKLRVWARESTASAYISWGQSIKASVVDANVVSGQWNDLELNEPIVLDKGITYVVWYSMPNYACKYKNSTISSDKDYVTYQGGRYATSRKTIPTNNENTAYGVDFYIDAYIDTTALVEPQYYGLSYGFVGDGAWIGYSTKTNCISVFEVTANHRYCIVGEDSNDLTRLRIAYFSGKRLSDFTETINNSHSQETIYTGVNINSDGSPEKLAGRYFYTPASDGVIVILTNPNSVLVPSYCIDMN